MVEEDQGQKQYLYMGYRIRGWGLGEGGDAEQGRVNLGEGAIMQAQLVGGRALCD